MLLLLVFRLILGICCFIFESSEIEFVTAVMVYQLVMVAICAFISVRIPLFTPNFSFSLFIQEKGTAVTRVHF